MTHAGYVAAGYGITLGALGAYAWWVVARRRVLSGLASLPGDGGTGAAAGVRGSSPDTRPDPRC